MGSRHFWIESQCWVAKALRRNVDGKPDYLHTFTYANGLPMTFASGEEALNYAVSACSDPCHALYSPFGERVD